MAVYWTPYITPVITTAAYDTGDALGAVTSFPNVPEHGTIMSMNLIDLDSESGNYTIIKMFLFKTGVTGVADSAALDFTDADLAECLGVISMTDADAERTNVLTANTILTKVNIAMPYWAPSGRLYFQLQVTGTPTFTAVSDIKVALGIVY
jgi:hypothetical protein